MYQITSTFLTNCYRWDHNNVHIYASVFDKHIDLNVFTTCLDYLTLGPVYEAHFYLNVPIFYFYFL